MIWFFLCVGILIAGYFTYGAFVVRIFGPKPALQTPAYASQDGVDFVPMSNAKVWLVQLLNIAGLGPVFGPILGALYGPIAMLWIVIGCIFAGAVHDYFSGMLSVRQNGASVPNIVGEQLGNVMKQFMNVFAVILLLLVGVVFVLGPAKLLGSLTGMEVWMWVGLIFGYYILATVMPIDKIIGRLYPVFGGLLIFMSIGLTIGLIYSGKPFFGASGGIENLFVNQHPTELPLWPLIFITIACGAISGFHSTQSPLMARCIQNEKNGHFVFYGAMIGEGIIALIWCTLGLSFYDSPEALNTALAAGGPAKVVHEVSTSLLGAFGGILAVLGVVVLPITSGDTAFRAARLIIAEFLKMSQTAMFKRLLISVPLFVLGYVVSKSDFDLIWRYFGWANQTVAAIMLWAAAAYLVRHGKFHWICTLPAIMMTAVVSTFLAYAKLGFGLQIQTATVLGVVFTIAVTLLFFLKIRVSDEAIKIENGLVNV